jgi:hypothetical protein
MQTFREFLNESSPLDSVDGLLSKELNKRNIKYKLNKRINSTSYLIGDDFKIINDGNVLSLYSGEDLVHQTNKVKVGYKTIISKLEDMV